MSWRTAQIRKTVSSNYQEILLVLLLLSLIGGYVTYSVYVSPGTETERIEDSSWSSTAGYSHHAVVQSETDVFEEGTVLENQPAYLSSVAPVLEGSFQYTYDASDSGELAVDIEQTLILRAVGNDGEFEYWREERDLGSERVSSLQPTEQVEVPFSVNVTETRLRIEEIESQLDGSSGESQILVQSNVTITGQRNGLAVNETNGYQIQIADQGSAYRVLDGEAVTDSGEQFRAETITASYGPLRSLLAPAVFGLAVLGIVGLVVGRRQQRFELSDTEREWLSYRAEADEFEEWLSTGTIPDEALSRTTVSVESLGDLVDIAIDSNRRVIRDRSRNICAVMLEETVYLFELPERPAERLGLFGPTADASPDEPSDQPDEPADEDAEPDSP